MQQLQNSKLRTQHSVIDNISVNDILPSSDEAERTEELVQICQWFDKSVQNGTLGSEDTSNSHLQNTQFSYFMVKLDSFHQLPFKKVHQQGKVHLHILATLVNIKTGKAFKKYSRMIKSLEEGKSIYLFDLKESLCFYFYTLSQKDIILRIQLLISESYHHQGPEEKEQPLILHLNPECLGFLQISLEKEVKNKEKRKIVTPGQHNIYQLKQQDHQIRGAFCQYYLSKSQAYKYLQKLVSPNMICSPSDRIAGIMGGSLPLNQNALSQFAITPDAQGLALQINSLLLNSLLLRDAQSKCEKYASNIYSNAVKLNFSTKNIVLKVFFHNSWKIVSEDETVLKEKEIERVQTNQSIISTLHHNKSKENISIIRQKQGGGFKRGNKMIKYVPEENLTLGLVFPGEEQCTLILQIYLITEVTGHFSKDSIAQQSQALKETLTIPMCFTLISAKGLTLRRSQSLKFHRGSGLTSYQQLSQMIMKNMNTIEITQRKAMISGKSKKSLGMIEKDSISVVKSIKTMSNATNMFTKAAGEIGSTEFEVVFRDKDPLVVTTLDNISLMLDNLSGFNLSRGDLKDKITAEKERILKETKKGIQVKKKMGIQFYPSVFINDKQKGQLTLLVSKQPSYHKIKEKEEILGYLKRYFPEFSQLQRNSSGSLSQPKLQQPLKHASKLYYSLRLSDRKNASFQSLKLTPYFYLLNSNYKYPINYSYFLYEKTPVQILRTELSEINYNNCFFINLLSMVCSPHQNLLKFPKTFFFKTRLFNREEIRSELMTVNQDTGQIIVSHLGEEDGKRLQKIMHQEISFDQTTDNYQHSFIHFIEYLYNGLLKMDMIDYETNHVFGWFMMPLRNLIRKRRNESIVIHEDYIVHRNFIRGRVKVEVRCLRKMKHKNRGINSPSQLPSLIREKGESKVDSQQDKVKEETENERIQARIMKFKENKNRKSSPKKKVEKMNQKEMQQFQELQTNKIQNIYTAKFLRQRKVLKVCALKKYFFFISVQNKHSQPTCFRLSINDEDEEYLVENPLSLDEQISIVKDIELLDKEERQRLYSIKGYKDKMNKCMKVISENSIQLDVNDRKQILLCYMSVRKYKDWNDQKGKINSEKELLSIYNRPRVINCSLINSINQTVQAIYSIEIVPVPDETNIELSFYRPQNQRSFIHLPFIDTTFLEQGIDQILVDDPFVLVSPAQTNRQSSDKAIMSTQKGLLIQINNQLKEQQCKEINMLFINGTRQKEKGNQSRKIQKSRIKSRIQLYQQYSYGPETITISLKIWGCLKFTATVELWKQSEGVFKLQTHLFSNLMSTYCFYLLSDSPQILKIKKNLKIKSDSHQLFKIMKENEVIPFHTSLTSTKVGLSYINIHVVEGKEVLEQQQGLLNNVFKEVQPIYRVVLCVETKFPPLKELIQINISRASQQKIIEEPFSYRSSCSKKTEFRVISSDSNLIWAKSTDSTFQLEPKSQRKISIFFHIENILDHSGLSGFQEFALIGVKWDRGLDYFGFKFHIT